MRQISIPRVFCLSLEYHAYWFRVFGYGACLQDRRLYPAFFSERTGHRKWMKLGPHWVFRFLAKNNY